MEHNRNKVNGDRLPGAPVIRFTAPVGGTRQKGSSNRNRIKDTRPMTQRPSQTPTSDRIRHPAPRPGPRQPETFRFTDFAMI